MDWHQLFGFTLSPWEIMLRGTVMYLGLFVLFRVIIRRRVGAVGMADILILVIVADAAQNGMAGEYKSITEGLLLVLTILGWNVLIDWLTYRFPALQGVLEPPPLLLIDRGRILRRNLRHELIAESELYAKLREQGVSDPSEVERAYIEADGQVTVIKKK
ncbi:MAG TPA: YetF domain-containing protein [Burkholderiales bacterium]|nr:YetF domain-containing protein [Burkholderiales bacterium]